MGERLNLIKVECVRDMYQLDIEAEDSKVQQRFFVRKDALLALLCVAEKEKIESGYYSKDRQN